MSNPCINTLYMGISLKHYKVGALFICLYNKNSHECSDRRNNRTNNIVFNVTLENHKYMQRLFY